MQYVDEQTPFGILLQHQLDTVLLAIPYACWLLLSTACALRALFLLLFTVLIKVDNLHVSLALASLLCFAVTGLTLSHLFHRHPRSLEQLHLRPLLLLSFSLHSPHQCTVELVHSTLGQAEQSIGRL